MKTAKNNVNKLPFEVFEAVQTADKQADRIALLQENESYELKTILQAAFRADIVFDLPAGAPPYTVNPSPAGMMHMSMKKHVNMLPLLLVGNPRWPKMKKEMSFIRLLEEVCEKDAEIFIAMKDKALTKKYSTLTPSLVKKAFTDLGI
jgi:hypothetical protein